MPSLATSDIPSPMSSSPDEPSFPTLELKGDQATAAGITDAKVGDIFTCKVKLKVKRVGDYGPSHDKLPAVGVEVMEIDEATPEDDEATPEDDETKPDKDKADVDPATARMFGPKAKDTKPVSPKTAGFDDGGPE
jgi:hypothetical protein